MGIDCKRPWLRHDRFLRRARRDHEIAEKRSRLRRGKQRSDPDREATESWRSLKLGDLSAKAQANPNPIPRRRLSEWTDRQGARPTITDPGREGMLDPLAEPRISDWYPYRIGSPHPADPRDDGLPNPDTSVCIANSINLVTEFRESRQNERAVPNGPAGNVRPSLFCPAVRRLVPLRLGHSAPYTDPASRHCLGR